MPATEVKHEGTVVGRLPDGSLEVQVIRHSACTACRARQLCFPSEQTKIKLQAKCSDPDLQIGESVWVQGCAADRRAAAVWFYLIPLALVITTLTAALTLGISEPLSALAALVILLPYLLLLRFVDQKKAKQIRFRAQRKHNLE